MTGMIVGKLELSPVEENNLGIAQVRLKIYSVTPYKEDHTRSKGILKFLCRYFFSHTILSETFVGKNNWLSVLNTSSMGEFRSWPSAPRPTLYL